MLRNTKSLLMITALLVVLLASACSASKAEKLNQEGNDAFAEQAFQDALVAYQTAQIEDPELAEPYYNAANALYRQGAYADALKQMEMALSYASEESLAQAGLYNLGNSSYNQQDLQTAVDSYTQSLLLNPDDQDAKYNLELALQQLQQQQNEQQQEEEQQDQSGEGDEQQEQDQSGEGESQDEQQQEQSQDQQDGQGDQQQEQDQSGQGDEEQPAEQQEGQESDQGQEGQEQQDEGQQQGQGEEQQDQEQQQSGQGQPQEGQPDQNQQGQLNQLPAPGQRMTEEQAEQLLAAIARDGQTLQEKLGQIFAVPWTPPVQDW